MIVQASTVPKPVTTNTSLFETIQRAAGVIRSRAPKAGGTGIILGTGLGGLAAEIEPSAIISYDEIPEFPVSTVESHAGRLLVGLLAGAPVIALQGRFHRYEGYTLQQVTFPVRVLRALGVQTLIVSNACGCVNPDWAAGDLMLIADHINLLGDSPLVGPNDDRLGPRFPDLSQPYDEALRAVARRVAKDNGVRLREGVYAAIAGPNLETRAEYRFLRTVGADVVGMSTVPEVIVAAHAGMRVLGVSIITDMCVPETLVPTTVDKIISVAKAAEPSLTRVVRGVVKSL